MTSAAADEIQHLTQRSMVATIARAGTEQWTTVYRSSKGERENAGIGAALVSAATMKAEMSRDGWDVDTDEMVPEFANMPLRGSDRIVYLRFGNTDGFEPLIVRRTFHGFREPFIELSEEFRHVMNLFPESNGSFVRFDRSGEAESVAEVSADTVRLKTRALRQFLAVKDMVLLLLFDSISHGHAPVDACEKAAIPLSHVDERSRYSIAFGENPTGEFRVHSLLRGKVVVKPLRREECGMWPYNKPDADHASFIVGVNQDGVEVEHSCDPSALGDYFGRNPSAPHFLTPVVFRRDVLQRYFGDTERFQVVDGRLHCGDLWSLPIDNQEPDRISVFLGDLGQTLPLREQQYWRTFNVAPKGDGKDISATTRARSFDAKFTDSAAPDHAFKATLGSFQQRWRAKFGWDLIRPLGEDDAMFSPSFVSRSVRALGNLKIKCLG